MSEFVSFHDLKDSSVFITGGGAGIGAAITEGFIEQGAKVAFVQRSDARNFVIDMEQKYGITPLFIQCDITDIDALQNAIKQAEQAHGPITTLVNNAANDARHSLLDYSQEQWDSGMAVNLRPHFFSAQAISPGMQKLGYGSIINFSSISYMMGNAGYPAYVASKAAITGLTRALARELGPDNIRVNTLIPGWVLTEKQLAMWATKEDLAAHMQRQCIKEHLAPQDIVDSTLFLASKASRMITGQALAVDGGVVVTG
jgi:NAD(P)-dependent dehydrogenase (short-subunit alcohol dehydrogenase family)